MALIRWEPARGRQTLQSEVNRRFGSFFDDAGGIVARRWIPPVDLVEQEGEYVLRADLPGVSEGDVKVEVQDRLLTVSGERRSEHEESREGYRRVERASGSFSRSLRLPEGVDPQAIEASFDNGVLEVKIPKPQEHKPQRVAINVGPKLEVVEGEDSTESTPDATAAAA